MLSCALLTSYNSTSIGVLMDDSTYGKNLQTQLTVAIAHQVAIAASMALAVRDMPHGRDLLNSFERDLLASSIWQLGNSAAPAEVGEVYRKEISQIFSRARAKNGW